MKNFYMLDIDLTAAKTEKVDITHLFERYIGGTGVASALFEEIDPDIDPLSPDAPIIFACGPFSSVFPVATKTVVMYKSPLSGNLGESHAGGRLAMAMYGAGYHVIRIRGKAAVPSTVEIESDNFKISSASSLRGMSALATERIIRDHYKSDYKRSIVRIGPAGERLSPIACATVDSSRHFGRLGVGAVLGSKNIKAIIVSGGKYWKIDNPGPFNSYYKKLYDAVVESDQMKKYHDLGTPVNVIPLSKINGLPTRNFSQGYFENAEGISGEAFATKHLAQQIACAHCPCGCIHMATLRECFNPDHNMYKTFKVSYDHELIFAWGSNLSIGSSEELLKLLYYVEKQCWDAISMGVILAWVCEAYQRGIITEEHTDGLVVNFGDAETFMKMLERISHRHNEFYCDLEKGSVYCAEKYGGKDFAIAFGKNEAPGYMTGLHSYLGYATGVRHSHLDSAGYSIDQKKINSKKTDSEWTKSMYDESVWRMVLNSLVICLFARNIYTPEIICEGLQLLGYEGFDEKRLNELAVTIHAMKTRQKKKFGFKFSELYLPKRLEKAATTCGHVTSEQFDEQVKVFENLVEADIKKLDQK
ncbi:MAG: aldehyde:ferredoxin oxidoreductase [Candidatus Riflebacteria bacterium HGW-Riflebacteria-2]|jgi:aldehyde:ferredoxin oxidoreductase|nr:MAG: aldehyde:ferredoxin oxidoreductase [Candidatus Riflebacteria bacterium HGW-Riflebacteria-2]